MMKKKKTEPKGKGLIDEVFSWSLMDVLNKDFYQAKVKEIPKTFSSTDEYLKYFIPPLVEETHADLLSGISGVSGAPRCEIVRVDKHSNQRTPNDLLYNIILKRNLGRAYEPEMEDLIALTDVRPKRIDDLNRPRCPYNIALVKGVRKKKKDRICILSSRPIVFEQETRRRCGLFAVFLINMKTNIRIWKALSSDPDGNNMKIIKNVLQPANNSVEEGCNICSPEENVVLQDIVCSSNLNESQEEAVLTCVGAKDCTHRNTVKLIWGPPGTGKTKTVGLLLFALLKMKCNTVTCASTNIAVIEVATRLKTLLTESLKYGKYGLGDVVLFGNGKRMKIEERDDLFDVFLGYRADILFVCLAPGFGFGFTHCLQLMKCLLENPLMQYRLYLENSKPIVSDEDDDSDGDSDSDSDSDSTGEGDNDGNVSDSISGGDSYRNVDDSQVSLYGNVDDSSHIKKKNDENKKKKAKTIHQKRKNWMRTIISQTLEANKNKKNPMEVSQDKNLKHERKEDKDDLSRNKKNEVGMDTELEVLTFREFLKKRFNSIGERLMFCIDNLCTHLPTRFIPLELAKNMIEAHCLLKSLGTMFNSNEVTNQGLEDLFKTFDSVDDGASPFGNLLITTSECHRILKLLPERFPIPEMKDISEVKDFCLANACLVFCTATSSNKLHSVGMMPQLLVIDEAAQLKESESAIPLLLNGLSHAILIGDERQLPAMVQSKISEKAEFGRSMFERLVLLGHKKHLLNVQYRMHPSISLFTNREFYDNQIVDAPNVKEKVYERRFLHGNMYGAYSFINVAQGKEEFGHGHSPKNLVELALVSELVASLNKECIARKQKVSVGIISPYKAQVYAIQEKLGNAYNIGGDSNFSVSVRSVDGFQGGEEDVIIISTVRSNRNGSVGFLSSLQRTNVALTRARYCLWILGNETTLINSGSVWKKLVIDAKNRHCFYNADEDKGLAQVIAASLTECDQPDNLFDVDSILFRKSLWKVCFSDDFLRSMEKIKKTEIRNEVVSLLGKLSNGWRPRQRRKNVNMIEGNCCQLLEKYEVNGQLNLFWSVDILRDNSNYVQVLKIWDIVPVFETPQLTKRPDKIFGNYTMNTMNHCNYKRIERNVQIPMRWPVDSNDAMNICPPKPDPEHCLSKELASLNLKDVPETSATRNREAGGGKLHMAPLLVSRNRSLSMLSLREELESEASINRNVQILMRWQVDSNDGMNICPPKPDPEHILSKELASLNLKDVRETSATRNREAGRGKLHMKPLLVSRNSLREELESEATINRLSVLPCVKIEPKASAARNICQIL